MSFSRDPNRFIATLIAGVIGLIVLIDFATPVPIVETIAGLLVNWAAVLAGLALFVGLLSVAGNHLLRVLRKREDWGYSMVLLLSMVAVIVSGVVVGLAPSASGNIADTSYVKFPTLLDPPIRTLFSTIYQPLASSFLALLAFFSLSAALRALRRRTADALVIVGVAMVVLLFASVPQIEGVPYFGDGLRWINDYLVLAGARGLLLGSALGALVAGVRVLLGFDQPYLDR